MEARQNHDGYTYVASPVSRRVPLPLRRRLKVVHHGADIAEGSPLWMYPFHFADINYVVRATLWTHTMQIWYFKNLLNKNINLALLSCPNLICIRLPLWRNHACMAMYSTGTWNSWRPLISKSLQWLNMGVISSQIIGQTSVCSTLKDNTEGNIKALYHCHFTGKIQRW